MAHREFIYIGEPLPKLDEKEHAAFFLNLQKGILLSLKQRNLLTPAQYQECLAELGKRESKKEVVELQVIDKNNKFIKDIVLIAIGIMGLKVGGDLTVNNAVDIANYFNLSEKLISLTILAVGTSLPELVTSVTAAIKGNSDIAIGNIIGSNIFNILLIIGTSAFITPITYNITYNFDFTVLLVSSIILALFPFIPPKNEMSRMNGIVYLLIYAGYMAILFIK